MTDGATVAGAVAAWGFLGAAPASALQWEATNCRWQVSYSDYCSTPTKRRDNGCRNSWGPPTHHSPGNRAYCDCATSPNGRYWGQVSHPTRAGYTTQAVSCACDNGNCAYTYRQTRI